jgi:hypothetical protein
MRARRHGRPCPECLQERKPRLFGTAHDDASIRLYPGMRQKLTVVVDVDAETEPGREPVAREQIVGNQSLREAGGVWCVPGTGFDGPGDGIRRTARVAVN